MKYLSFDQRKYLYKSRALVASAIAELADAVDASSKAGSDSIKIPVQAVISDLNLILATIGGEIVRGSGGIEIKGTGGGGCCGNSYNPPPPPGSGGFPGTDFRLAEEYSADTLAAYNAAINQSTYAAGMACCPTNQLPEEVKVTLFNRLIKRLWSS